jgi:hypothetical protein
MPFGLANAPAAFQHFMNDIFRDLLDIYVVVYLDDILIFSKTCKEHVTHVSEVLRCLKENQLYCQLEKCSFFLSEVDYLGIIASREGIRVDPTKVTQAVNWPVPKNVKNVQEFLGFANFYRRFIANYSKVARPLFDLLHKDQSWKWTEKEQKALDEMKFALQSAPVLIQPDPYKEFFLECDASDFATRAILSQKGTDGKLHPVAFLSKSLSPAKKNYDIFDKELLAIIRAFKEWRHLLEGSDIPIQVLTDHRNLEHFSGMKPLNRRQIRWANFLVDYNFIIKYRPGVQNKKADLLSRRVDLVPPKEGGEPSMLLKPELFIAAIRTHSDLDDAIRDALQDDTVGSCKLQLHFPCSLFLCLSLFCLFFYSSLVLLLLCATIVLVLLSFVLIVCPLCILLLWTTFVTVPLLLSLLYIVSGVFAGYRQSFSDFSLAASILPTCLC